MSVYQYLTYVLVLLAGPMVLLEMDRFMKTQNGRKQDKR